MKGLPHDSAVGREIDPNGVGVGWRHETELLAVLAELVDAHLRLDYNLNKKKGMRSPDPIRIPRPQDPPVKRQATAAEIKEMFSGLKVYSPKGDMN